MAFDLSTSYKVRKDVNGKPTASTGFDIASSRSVDTPFYEGFSVKEDVVQPFVKGARDIAVSSPQKFAGLLVEFGERAEEMPGFFDNAAAYAVPFHSIYKNVQALKAKMKPSEGKAYADAGKEIIKRNQTWIDNNIEGYGDKEEGLAGWMYDIGGGVTTLGAAIGVSALTRSPAAAGALFGIFQKGDIYMQGREAGLSSKKAGRLSTAAGGVEGMLEYIGLDWMMNKASKSAYKLVVRMASEAAQEGSQTFAENLIVKYGGIDGQREVLEGVARSAIIGAVLGGGANVIMAPLERAGMPEKQAKKVSKEIYTEVEAEVHKIAEQEPPASALPKIDPETGAPVGQNQSTVSDKVDVREQIELGSSYAEMKQVSPDEMITVYRASVKGGKAKSGDFITTNREQASFYARDILGQRGEESVEIVTEKIRAGDLSLKKSQEAIGVDDAFIYKPQAQPKTPKPKPTIESTLKTIQETFKKPETITRKEVKAIQGELISQMEASGLEAKDKAKFIKTIKNTQTARQLEKIAKDFRSRLARVKEQTQKAKLSVSIKKELTKTKPVKKGQRKVGKYDYEGNVLFKELRGYSKLSQAKAQAALDEVIPKTNMDLMKRRMLSLRANGAKASLEAHKQVLADIKLLKSLGTAAKDNADFDKLVNRMENVEEAMAGIEKVKGGQNITAAIKKGYAKGFGNIDSLFSLMFGKKFTDKYSPEVNESERNTAIYFKTKEITVEATAIYGKDILQVFQEMSDEKFDLTDVEGLTHEVDRMQLIDIYNSLKNDSIKKRYYDSFGEDQVNSLMDKLSVEDELVGDLLQEAVQEYRQVLNERNIEITGQDLGSVDNYWPATSEHQPSVYDDYRLQGETPSAMKERAKGKVTPRPVSAWSKFNKHVGEAEHVKHLAREHEQLMRMFTDRKVKHAIEKKFGEDVYRTTMALMDGISLNAQVAKIDSVSDLYGKALNNWIKAKLPSLSIFLRQLMSASNYMEVMPAGEWSKGYTKALLSPKKTFNYMWENAPFLEARFHKGYKEALSRALDDAAKMSGAQSKWAKGLSALVRVGDMSAIIYGGKPYVDHLISTGMSEKAAFKKFEKATLRAQQSGLNSSLSQFQQNKTVFARMLMAFKNTPAQYMRKMGDAIIAHQNGDITDQQLAKTMTIYGVIQPTLYVMAGWAYREGFRAIGRLFRGEEPEERDPLWKDIAKQMVVNPVTAIPFISGAADYATRKMLGMKAYSITSLPMISDIETALRKGTKQDITFDDWVTIVGTPIEIATSAPVLSLKRMYRYLVPENTSGSDF